MCAVYSHNQLLTHNLGHNHGKLPPVISPSIIGFAAKPRCIDPFWIIFYKCQLIKICLTTVIKMLPWFSDHTVWCPRMYLSFLIVDLYFQLILSLNFHCLQHWHHIFTWHHHAYLISYFDHIFIFRTPIHHNTTNRRFNTTKVLFKI